MKVGDYVRTKDYGFIKIKSFYYSEDLIHILDENNYEYDFSNELVDNFKSSPNIIDLIEIGDIIKYHQVQNNYIKTNILYKAIKNGRELIELEYDINHNKKSIISIVTHEQFESMEYKVGE